MLYKATDKIYYDRAPSGDPKGVVKHVTFNNKQQQVCTIKCGQVEYVVLHSQLRPRTVNTIAQVSVSTAIKQLGTRQLLVKLKQMRYRSPFDYYNLKDFYQSYSDDFNEFFNDIGFDDYEDRETAQLLLRQKFERDVQEIRYELSQREHIETGYGAKLLRQKKAIARHGKSKHKNR